MKKKRLIPVLLLKNGWLVQSKDFSRYQNLGNPFTAVKRLSEWAADELIYLDISKDDKYDTNRDDQAYANHQTFLEIIKDVCKSAFMPITVGGKIKSIEDIEKRLSFGADKISINSMALSKPKFVEEAVKEFGSQCIVLSIDVKFLKNKHFVFSHEKSDISNYEVLEWSKKMEDLGVGEIFLNSIDRDGSGKGYDIDLLNKVSNNLSIPVIACGGVGKWEHFSEALKKTKVDAVAAANIFHYTDQSIFIAKKYLFEQGLSIRKPDLIEVNK